MKRKRTATVRRNFTKRLIESIPKPVGRRTIIYDSATKGLGCVTQPGSGSKSYFWFRKIASVPTWRTLGSVEDLSVEQARAKASEWNSQLASWKLNDFAGPGPLEERRDLALSGLLDDYCSKHLAANAKNPEKAESYVRWQIDRYVGSWKARKLASIRSEHCRELHQKLGETAGQVTANRTLQLVRVLFNHAKREGLWSGENPAIVRPFKEASRTRFLQPPELQRLFKALDSRATPRDLRDFVKASLFCGARRSDTLSMRWDQLDLERGIWHIPSPKNAVPYDVPLVPEVIELIKKRRAVAAHSEYVFPSPTSASGHLEDPKRNWQELLARAEITDFKIHDLRRSYGSYQAALGTSLLIIGRSLGHASTAATSIYSRLQLDPIRTSVTAGVQAMLTAAKAKTPATATKSRKHKQLKV